MAENDAQLFRFGLEPESAAKLEAACEDAVDRGFPHCVPAFSRNVRADACSATRSGIEVYFRVEKTGNRRTHFTVVLPHPVTKLDAARFNQAFGRGEGT